MHATVYMTGGTNECVLNTYNYCQTTNVWDSFDAMFCSYNQMSGTGVYTQCRFLP